MVVGSHSVSSFSRKSKSFHFVLKLKADDTKQDIVVNDFCKSFNIFLILLYRFYDETNVTNYM